MLLFSRRLRQAKRLSNYSPKDIIEQSKAIWLTKIRGEWNIAEMTEKTWKLFAQIGVVFPAKLE